MLRKIKDYLVLKHSGLFDEEYYCLQYPDVRQADVNPLWHFVSCGWKEGRNPSANFDTNNYMQLRPDLKDADSNPLFHYIRFGIKEDNEPKSNILSDSSISENKIEQTSTVQSNTIINENVIERPISIHYDVSIIVPVFNTFPYVKACYSAIVATTENIELELIFIDNNSTDGVAAWLDMLPNFDPRVKVIHNTENKGFGIAVNQGISISKGRFVALVNSDTVPGEGWLQSILDAAKADLTIGIFSPFTNYVGEGPQIDPEAAELRVEDVSEFSKSIRDRKGMLIVPDRLVFFCVVIRRELIDLIGGLDETYIRGNFEDDDYCLRTILAGFKLAIVKNSFVYHHGSTTFKSNKLDYVQHYEENRSSFFLKADRLSTILPRMIRPRDVRIAASVIVRTVNRPYLLRKALNSLANQNDQNFEVVLVNDGGPLLEDLIREYDKHLSIQYIHHKKSTGRTHALNSGLNAAKGDWVCFLDDDDIYYPWFFGVMLNAVDQKPDEKFFYGGHTRVLLDPKTPNVIHTIKQIPVFEYNREELLISNSIPINTWFVQKEEALNINGFDESFDTLEDYDFLLRFSSRFPLNSIRQVIGEYRFYLSQQNTISSSRNEMLAALHRIYNRFESTNQQMKEARESVLNNVIQQTQEVNELIATLDSSTDEEKDKINRKILRLANAI